MRLSSSVSDTATGKECGTSDGTICSSPVRESRFRSQMALFAGFAAQILQYGSGLLLLPFILIKLPAAEVGVWYIFITLQGLAALADFGFQPTFARSFSTAYAGATHIIKNGLAETNNNANLPLVRDILRLCRQFYCGLSVFVLALMASLGYFYLPTIVHGEEISLAYVQNAWSILSFSTALSIYFSWNNGFLFGAGKISATYWGQIVSRVGFLLIGSAALLFGWGLIGLAIANLTAVLTARVMLQWQMAPLFRQLEGTSNLATEGFADLFSAIWPNAVRMGLVALGAFLITRLNVLIASSFFSLEVAASYAITIQFLTAVNSVAQLPIAVAIPDMVELRVRNQKALLRSTWLLRQSILLILFGSGVCAVAFIVQPLLGYIDSSVQLLPTSLILLMGLVLLLEANHSSCALVITTGNSVPFVGAALWSGFSVAVLAITASWAGLGVAGLICAQGAVQLAYNNWKWPLELWRELN